MKELAPVSITVYSRLEHVKQTIEALKKNYLSDQTILYVFSDAPKKGDEIIVQRVRDYLDSVSGFKDVIVVKQESNSYEKNIKDAYTIPLKKYGKLIRMEDDIVTSPYFLTYMNHALEFYQNDKSIFAISGYTPNVDLSGQLADDVYLSKDFNAWGYATWEDRDFIYARERMDYYSNITKDKKLTSNINKLHPLMIDILHLVEQHKTNPGDYKLSANLHLNNLFVIKPKVSLVKNIGFDGSGNSNTFVNKFDTDINESFCPKLFSSLVYNEYIDKVIFGHYFNENFLNKLKSKLILKLKIYIPDNIYNKIKKITQMK